MEKFTNNEPINKLLNNHINDFEKVINNFEKKLKDNDSDFNGFNEYDKKMFRLKFNHDIIRSLSQYVLSTDEYVESKVKMNIGLMVYTAIFKRNGDLFTVGSEAIYAEGPIQSLHIRLITKSNVKSINVSVKTNSDLEVIKNEIKKLSKGEKIRQEITRFENIIKKYKNNIENYSKLSDIEYLKEYNKSGYNIYTNIENATWKDAQNNPNWENDEEKFKIFREGALKDYLGRRVSEISRTENTIKAYEKEIEKLNKKLEKIL